jgi:gamma-glutamyltranspeptidase/glutathione hydrolase
VEFGMNMQEAIDAPNLCSAHNPSSFYPREAHPGRITADPLIPAETLAELRRRGHEIILSGPWEGGKVLAIRYDKANGVIMGAASPKGNISYAMGW